VRGRECLHADRVVNLRDGRFPAGYPYNEFVLATYWLPDDPRAHLSRLDCTGGRFVVDSRSLPFIARAHPRAPTQGPEWDQANAQFSITWSLPAAMRERIGEAVVSHIDSRNPRRFSATTPAIYPWADPAAELVIEARTRIATVEPRGPGAHAQLNFMVYLLDTASGKFFSYVVGLYAWPDYPPHAVANDGEFAFISTRLPRDGTPDTETRYFRRAAGSRGSSQQPWSDWRFFRFHIGRRHLARAIADLNASDALGARGFSTDPAAYLLTSAGIIQEHYWHRGGSVVMDSSFGDFAVSLARKRVRGGE
jgi:hypothetical protein